MCTPKNRSYQSIQFFQCKPKLYNSALIHMCCSRGKSVQYTLNYRSSNNLQYCITSNIGKLLFCFLLCWTKILMITSNTFLLAFLVFTGKYYGYIPCNSQFILFNQCTDGFPWIIVYIYKFIMIRTLKSSTNSI